MTHRRMKNRLKEYKKELKLALLRDDHYNVNRYNYKIGLCIDWFKQRAKNKKKNEKQYKKAN